MMRRIGALGLAGLVMFAAAVARGDPEPDGVARTVGRPLAQAAACAIAENLVGQGPRIASANSPVVRPIASPIGSIGVGQAIAGGVTIAPADPADRAPVSRVAGDAATSLEVALGCSRTP